MRDVHDFLRPRHPLAYTTVLTVMDRLTRKGFLARSRRGKAFVYQPQCSFEESRDRAVADLILAYFDGSASQLKAFLAGESSQKESASRSEVVEKPRSAPQLNECLL